MSESPITKHLAFEKTRIGEIRRKRYIVAFDHLKTLSFGFIGAACINPVVKQIPLDGLAYATIIGGGSILGAMVIWPQKMR